VLHESTTSTPGTRVDGLHQRSLTDPATISPEVAPEVVPRTGLDANTVATTKTKGDLDITRSSTMSDSGPISPKKAASNSVDGGLVELANGQRSQLTSGIAVGAKKVVKDEALSLQACLQEQLVRPASGYPHQPLVVPSGECEFVYDNGDRRFTPARQVEAPAVSEYDTDEWAEPLLLPGPGIVDKKALDNDSVQLHHLAAASERSGEINLTAGVDIAALDSIDVLPDDVFLPEVIPRSNSDKPEMAVVRVDECAVPEVAGDREERQSVLSRQDSFNRPDSPLFHHLIDLPRDSVILRNRRRRRCRRDSSSTSSTSSSSSSFLSHSRHSVASGTA